MSNDTAKNKNLIKGVGIYAVGTFGTKLLSFLIVPLYTYYIAKGDFGAYDILMSTISLLTPLVTMQISDAAYRFIIRDDVEDKQRYIRATFQVLVINCLLASGLILLVGQFWDIPYLFYFMIILVLSRAYQTAYKILRGLKNQWLFAMAGIVFTVVLLTMNVVQLTVLHMGVECLFQSTIAANAVALIVIFIFEPGVRVNLLRRPEKKLIFEMYRYSVPLVPNYLNWWVINSSDRYIVLWALGSAANGILAVAHKFPTMLQTVMQLFTNSWTDLSVADTEKETGGYYTKVFRTYYLLAFTLLLGLIPATKLYITWIMGQDYKEACDFVAFYYMGTVFQSFASFYGVGYLKSGQTGRAFSTSVYGAIVNAAVNLALIWTVGLQAAAVSTYAGFGVMWLVRERQNRKELGISVNWAEFIPLCIAATAMCAASVAGGVIANLILFVCGGAAFLVINRAGIGGVAVKLKSKLKKSR